MRIASLFLSLMYFVFPPDGPQDNRVDNVRPVPPPGIVVSADDGTELTEGLAALHALLGALRNRKPKPDLLADVEVYDKAVRYALKYNEFFRPQEIPVGKQLLK